MLVSLCYSICKGLERGTMARRFTKDRLSEAGEKSARRAQAEHRDLVFNCVFRGVCDEEGNIDSDAKIKNNSLASFEWTVRATNVDETCAVTVKCDNACVKGVPLSPSWEKCHQKLDDR